MAYKPQKFLPPRINGNYLPNFCDSEVFLRVLLVIELMAIVFALVSYDAGSLSVHIAFISLIMQWIGLSVAGVLCLLTRHKILEDALITTLAAFALTLVMTLIVSLLSVTLTDMMRFNAMGQGYTYLLLRNSAVATILIGLALRHFYLQFESEMILQVQAQARLQALQARIRPHFLFNSMNTIASLTHDQPDLAEQAIENLSDLFRASLAAEASISLRQELELTRSYVELESLRLGERLKVNWRLPPEEIHASLPALTLQPLVENAIYHGIEPISEGGEIDILVEPGEQFIEIRITNPFLEDFSIRHREGNNMAVENIQERLLIAFNGQASMLQSDDGERFTVTLKLPLKAA